VTETVIKIALIPISMLFYFVIARVVHLNPQLITNLFAQTSNAQSMSLQQRAIACDPNVERVLQTMSRKQLNDFVADCEASKK
jgi:hypothetical protein